MAVIHAGRRTTYGELTALRRRYESQEALRSGARIGVAIRDPASWIAALGALDSAGANALLLGARDSDELVVLRSTLNLDDLWQTSTPPEQAGETAPSERPGTVTLLTSGTTGEPKTIEHSWETLARPVRHGEGQEDARWLCAYPLRLYAGTQVMLQALVNGATLVIPEAPDPATVANLIVEAGVTHASGTPTFWRQLCLFGGRRSLARSELQQITLGGEAVPQDLLEALRKTVPSARIVHIYASTELGRLFSVTDGREGFPAEYLDAVPGGRVELEIRDGELFARSANAMIGGEDWTATGDLVQRVSGRVVFRGRRTDIINVGGSKVSPLRVEAALRQVEGVADLRIYSKSSSLAGQLVACDLVAEPAADPEEVKARLLKHARASLSAPEQPRIVRLVERIDSTAALKVARGERES
ncbi:MAG: AMP-binding protein [Acidobacteria bacterium]|nr:AMP-binding protein [Acidobacteriota bacterium]NIM60446.1 AMP-binding protein [Acidobacteriota bacterium]NIO59664.1 AMP-binding protein [Acidobacteriota bacterium]NIQ30758.1 AMP-binding protein [Acidobacteriota bacterium]NIQ84383.1 AMP-binding protein [Acidobacteriota bacterium]